MLPKIVPKHFFTTNLFKLTQITLKCYFLGIFLVEYDVHSCDRDLSERKSNVLKWSLSQNKKVTEQSLLLKAAVLVFFFKH